MPDVETAFCQCQFKDFDGMLRCLTPHISEQSMGDGIACKQEELQVFMEPCRLLSPVCSGANGRSRAFGIGGLIQEHDICQILWSERRNRYRMEGGWSPCWSMGHGSNLLLLNRYPSIAAIQVGQMRPEQRIGIALLVQYGQDGMNHLPGIALPPRIMRGDDVADTRNTQLCPVNANPAIIDAQMRKQPPLLLDDPGVFRAITRVVQVERLKVAPGQVILGQ